MLLRADHVNLKCCIKLKMKTIITRRETLKNLVSLPVVGLFGAGAYRSQETFGAEALPEAAIQINHTELDELKGELPKGKLGKHEISRLIMGGNLIVGSDHARDLKYAGKLFRAYNTEKKVFETLMLAEKPGINAISTGLLWSLELVAKCPPCLCVENSLLTAF